MKIHRLTRCKATLAALLAVLAVGMLCASGMSAYAAGNVNVRVVEMKELGSDFEGFTFELYKVGVYNNGEYSLDKEFADMDISIPSGELYDKTHEYDDQERSEKWMSAAASLANHISHPADGEQAPSPLTTYKGIKPGNPITISADDNGLYLLVGSAARYDNAIYTPLPMYLCSIIGTEINAEVKINKEPIVFKHSMMKVWDDNDDEAGVRPGEIEVGIYYGSQLIDRVDLGGEGGEWTYTWDSEESGSTYCYIGKKDGQEFRKEFTPDADAAAWSVREFTKVSQITDPEAKAEADNMAYYKPEYEKNSSGSMESFVINNPYNPPENPPENPPSTPDKPGKGIDTGDQTNIALWLGVLGVAAIALIIAFIRRGKDK